MSHGGGSRRETDKNIATKCSGRGEGMDKVHENK